LNKSATIAIFTSVRVDCWRPPLSSFLPFPFHLEIENTTWKRMIGSELHSHKPLAPTLVFLSQLVRLWNRILWQISVHFRYPWRIKKNEFTIQVINRTLSKLNVRKSVCERMLLDSI
jgi:hypothetical protein